MVPLPTVCERSFSKEALSCLASPLVCERELGVSEALVGFDAGTLQVYLIASITSQAPDGRLNRASGLVNFCNVSIDRYVFGLMSTRHRT